MLDVSNYIAEVRQENPRLGLALDRIMDAINQTATVTGVDSTAHASPPNPPQAINVKANNGVAHVTLTDASQRSRALNYFVEADTDPNFGNPHVEHLGASRGKFFALPGLNDNGDSQPWHFRAYSMALGSKQRSSHIVFGGFATPTAVTVGGTTQLTPLPSTGAGTASTSGGQGGQGFGTAQFSRPEIGIKAP